MSAQPAKRPPSEVNGHAQGNKMPRTTPPAGEDAEAVRHGCAGVIQRTLGGKTLVIRMDAATLCGIP